MPDLNLGDPAPAFSLPTDDGEKVSLADFKGSPLILYFYPKDDTPGCTKEACSFTEALPKFSRGKAAVLGVSKDSPESHKKFREKYGLAFPLASDGDGKVCAAYGVWKQKNLYGKISMGIERTTFLIDGTGKIVKIWRKVKVDGHTEEVLEALAELGLG
jgi:peroxiredoxin Q/BCP